MRYYIRQKGSYVSGPHELDAIRGWIRERKVRPEMEFSEDGVDWALGYEMLDLFPVKQESRRTPPARRSTRRAIR